MSDQSPSIQLGAFNYRIGKLSAMDQFHLARKLSPILATVGQQLFNGGEPPADDSKEKWLLSMIGPVTKVISDMTEADANYTMNIALKAVFRQDSEKWVPILVPNSASVLLRYQDISARDMVRLAVEVAQENLGDFFEVLLGGGA